MSDSKLSLDNFKRWIKSHDEMHFKTEKIKNGLIGVAVESKVDVVKIIEKMSTEETDEEEIAEDFVKNGGVIADVAGRNFVIEVKNGSFIINRCYVTRKPLP